MTTANDIVIGAAEEIAVKTAEIPLEPDDYQVIFNRMNDMLSEWADEGLTTSFKVVSNSTDTVDVERSSVAAIKYNLAVRCAPAFQKLVTPALESIAESTLNRLKASVVFIGDPSFPDTLPQGSGNDCPDRFLQDRFFGPNKSENF
jgi:hypothetical protein